MDEHFKERETCNVAPGQKKDEMNEPKIDWQASYERLKEESEQKEVEIKKLDDNDREVRIKNKTDEQGNILYDCPNCKCNQDAVYILDNFSFCPDCGSKFKWV